ncbi:alpha/beta fold hydrolase [Wenzhouxiangella sp. EGI_FJ10409]|uniref:alpha/beta fold hydrolase n=1 Tax=Wenzhouxiangella sp. EGI_FJ10409 TaxID=3243767 RepID=UPI0035E157A4
MKRRLLVVVGVVLGLWLAWGAWTERYPEEERELRIQVQEQLWDWFPEQMSPAEQATGFFRHDQAVQPPADVEVVLVHGVDEPGGIWSQLQQRLDTEGIEQVEFRYPNDQAVDASADALASAWPGLASSRRVVLVGHSMGGLVIRDFVSRHRHPVESAPTVDGPEVRGTILIATPNHGSEWARLRAWLELREYAADLPAGDFSLFAALRDGTGAAKIDLRPGSEYLQQLNARPWPDTVPIRIIGGRIAEPTPVMERELADLSQELGLPELKKTISELWSQTGQSIGDGAVAVDSLPLQEAPPPMVLQASHRGLIAPMPFSDRTPPAIAPVIDYLNEWRDSPTASRTRN